MIEIDSPYGPGRIGLATSSSIREPMFYYSLHAMKVPHGTRIAGQDSAYLHENRNAIVRQTLKSNAEWLFFVDDDNVFPSDTLMRLLAHDRPIIGSVYVNKQYPWIPHVYRYTEGTPEQPILFRNIPLAELPVNQVVAVDGLATSGMLIRREVLERLGDRAFRIDELGDDLGFCHRAKLAGFELAVDTGSILQHVGRIPLAPHYNEEEKRWVITAQVSPTEYIEIG